MPSKRTRAWRAPGRVNIIGEHIDYLGGTVLPFACDLELVVSVSDSDHIDIRSVDADAAPYVRGVEEALHAHGLPIHPCSGDITSAIPVGAGLSSSAAIAAGLALALTRGRRVSPALLQDAEIRASGVRGGVMDQTAVLESRAGHALLLDCATGTFEHVAIPEEISFVVVDTGTRRELTDGRYAQRRAEVEAGHPMRRAHTDAEQRRVFDAVDAMRAGDVASLGALVDASHASLRDYFEVSSPELDAAVAQAVALPGCTGARLVGGGFAGCVLAVVEAGAEQDVAAEFDTAYVVKAVDGAGPARST